MRRGGGPGGPLGADLKLSDEQRKSMRDVMDKSRDAMRNAHDAVMEKQRALAELVRKDGANDEAIRKAADELGKAIGDRSVLRAKTHANMQKILTAEQVETLKKARAERQQRGPRPGAPEKPRETPAQ